MRRRGRRHAPKRLAADATQITAACATLANSYNQALGTYETAVAPIPGQVKSTLASVRAARQTAWQTHDWAAYAAAIKLANSALKGLRDQVRAAQQASIAVIRSARQTFWTTIRALPGASPLPVDTGMPAPPTAPIVPTSA